MTASSARPADQLKAALRDKQLLLLLDNFEQVLAAAPLVAELLAAAPRLKVLVTSRAALHLSRRAGVRGAAAGAAADPTATLTTGSGRSSASCRSTRRWRCSSQRAQAAQAGFRGDGRERAGGGGDLRAAGRAAAGDRAGGGADQAVLARGAAGAAGASRLALLTGGARDLPARQQTIRSTIDWSYDLLNADEQPLFRRLGVFVGGCTLEAAEAVCGSRSRELGVDGCRMDPPTPISNCQPPSWKGLASLVDHSLLVVLEPVEGEPRYGMLETLREYALERLRAAGEEIDVRRRHAAFFAAWVEQVRPSLRGDNLITSERLGASWATSARCAGLEPRTHRRGYALWSPAVWDYVRALVAAAIPPKALLLRSARWHVHQHSARISWRRGSTTPPRGCRNIPFATRRASNCSSAAWHWRGSTADRPLQAEVLRHLGEATNLTMISRRPSCSSRRVLRISREINDAEQEGWTTFGLGNVAARRGDRMRRSAATSIAWPSL